MSQPASITPDFPTDSPDESLLIDLSGFLSEAATAAIRLSNDGRISSSAQDAFWSLSQQSLELGIRIDELWYQILATEQPQINSHRQIAEAAANACSYASTHVTSTTLFRAYEALGGANEAIRGLLDRASR